MNYCDLTLLLPHNMFFACCHFPSSILKYILEQYYFTTSTKYKKTPPKKGEVVHGEIYYTTLKD